MRGRYFEELEPGEVIVHAAGRTMTEADNVLFSCLTMNPQPLHLDFDAASRSEYGRPIVGGLQTLSVTVGMSVGDLTVGTTLATLSYESVTFPKPVFFGDTLRAETEVIEKRPSKSRPDWGIVVFEHRAKNQHGELVLRCRRVAMMQRRPAGTAA